MINIVANVPSFPLNMALYPTERWPPSASAKRSLASIASVLETTTSSKPDELNAEFKKEIERLNIKTGDYFMDMRVAIMGSKFTPPITESTLIIGIPESLQRVKNALGQLG